MKRLAIWRILVRTMRDFVHDDGFTMASSIAFFFLLSFIPFSSLCIFVFTKIQRLIFTDAQWGKFVSQMLMDEIGHIIPFVSRAWLKENIMRPPGGTFQLLNLALLPVVSGFIFQTLESSYRKIFGLRSRHLLIGQAIYALVSIFVVLFLFVSNFIWIILSTALGEVVDILHSKSYLNTIYVTVRSILDLANFDSISLVVLVVFYLVSVKIFLNVRLKWNYRLICAICFGCLWILARSLFGWYVTHVARINFLYGSLSSLVIVLLWIYYSAVALLFTLEMLHVLHKGLWHRRFS